MPSGSVGGQCLCGRRSQEIAPFRYCAPRFGRLGLKFARQDGCTHLQIGDGGLPCSPLAAVAPSMTRRQEMAVGGFGIEIACKPMAGCRYAYCDGYT